MKSKHTAPSYQWFPQDFAASTAVRSMNLEERGAYRDLLDACWMDGSIPNDISELAALLGVTERKMERIWRKISKNFFDDGNGRLSNQRIESERAGQIERRRKRSESGRKGMQSRWGDGKQRYNDAITNDNDAITNDNLSSSVSTSVKPKTLSPSPDRKRANGTVYSPEFLSWYETWLRKTGKKRAFRFWKRLNQEQIKTLVSNTPAWIEHFKSRSTEHVPYPATFINDEDWYGPPPVRKDNESDENVKWRRTADGWVGESR